MTVVPDMCVCDFGVLTEHRLLIRCPRLQGAEVEMELQGTEDGFMGSACWREEACEVIRMATLMYHLLFCWGLGA